VLLSPLLGGFLVVGGLFEAILQNRTDLCVKDKGFGKGGVKSPPRTKKPPMKNDYHSSPLTARQAD
jgi:hypothetical protein